MTFPSRLSRPNPADDILVRNTSGSTIPRGTLVYVTGTQGAFLTVAKVSTPATSLDTLFIAKDTIPNGKKGKVVSTWHRSGLDTTGSTVGDPVYLGGNGSWALGGWDPAIQVGMVTEVGTSGKILFDTRVSTSAVSAVVDPVSVRLDRLLVGMATIINGQTSVTVGLGLSYADCIAFVSFGEAPTAATKVWATGTDSAGDLVITIDQDNTADLDINYIVDARV